MTFSIMSLIATLIINNNQLSNTQQLVLLC
jgi:hypothetical protein